MAVISLCLQIVLSKYFGEVGCAAAIAAMFFLGQGVIMNVYYARKQSLDIITFWSEILKMAIIPMIITIVSIFILKHYNIDSWLKLLTAIGLYCVVYIPLLWIFSMNRYEKDLVSNPIKKLYKRVRNNA